MAAPDSMTAATISFRRCGESMPTRILADTGKVVELTAERTIRAKISGFPNSAEPAHLLKTTGTGQPKLRSIHCAPTRPAAATLAGICVSSAAMNWTPTGVSSRSGPKYRRTTFADIAETEIRMNSVIAPPTPPRLITRSRNTGSVTPSIGARNTGFGNSNELPLPVMVKALVC